MALQNLGEAPIRPEDVVDIRWVEGAYPSFSAFVEAETDFTIDLPLYPVDRQMQVFEAYNGGHFPITITVPGSVLLTQGQSPMITIGETKTAFFGFRYSVNRNSWFLLSSAQEV